MSDVRRNPMQKVEVEQRRHEKSTQARLRIRREGLKKNKMKATESKYYVDAKWATSNTT